MFIFFSLFFLFTTLVLFILAGFRINSYHGNRILLIYTQMNMYTFYMCYMYTVTEEDMQRIERGHFLEEDGGRQKMNMLGSGNDFVDVNLDDYQNMQEDFDQKMEKEEGSEKTEEKKNDEFGNFEL